MRPNGTITRAEECTVLLRLFRTLAGKGNKKGEGSGFLAPLPLLLPVPGFPVGNIGPGNEQAGRESLILSLTGRLQRGASSRQHREDASWPWDR